jgi:AcrR family transcriptional regulator
MATQSDDQGARGGLRERKRQETLERITEAGMRLFIANGYEATTLDDIAAEAGISRRTFFYYFKSKDDILLSAQSTLGSSIVQSLEDEPLTKSPFIALRDAMLRITARYPQEQLKVLDGLMRSSAAVQARKQASYVEHERTVFVGLKKRWPNAKDEIGLRVLAMIAIGVVRLSTDVWYAEGGKRSITEVAREIFKAIERKI